MAHGPGPAKTEIVLVSMPFGPLAAPSIGLELLKGLLPPGQARVRYFTLSFAREIGAALYADVCTRLFYGKTFVGDWLFSPALFCDEALEPAAERAAAEAYFAATGLAARATAEELERLLAVRAEVEGFLAHCQAVIEGDGPRIVGFTSTFQQHVAALALARRLKASRPDLFVVFGGANLEGAMGLETVRSFPFVDAAVSGEGEPIFPALVERVLAGRPVDDLPGVYTPANAAGLDRRHPPNAPRQPDLDALPRLDYGEFFAQRQEAGLDGEVEPRLLFETSRGCWWGERQHCTFCGLNGGSMAFRSKSADRALSELAELVRRYPGERVLVVDNILDMRYFRDFLPALAEAGLGVDLFYEVKANLRKDQLRLLRAAGVREIQPGIESLSDPVLRLMGKGVTALQNVQLLKWSKEVGIWPSWNLLWGFPGEPPEEYRRMAAMMPLLAHLPPPGFATPIRIDRFSPNFERAEEMGFANVEPGAAYRHIYPVPAEALRNLAYTFDYAYPDGRDVEGYTREVAAAVVAWREAFRKSSLMAVDRGDQLCLWDLRPAARAPLTVLSGVAKSLYQACDGIRTVAALAQGELSRGQVEDEIGPWVEAGLMLRQGDQVLALATAARGEGG